MKDKSKVKARNIWKVANILAEDPNSTRREIESKTWLHPLTIQKAKEELNQNWTKDPTIAYIVGSAKERLQRISGILDRYIDESEEKPELDHRATALIKDIAKDDLARITLLWWNATDEQGWLKAGVIVLPSLNMNDGWQTDTMEA